MADTTLVVTDLDREGIVDIETGNGKATSTAGAGFYYSFANDGKVVLIVTQLAAGADTYTFTAIADKYGRTESLAPVAVVSTTAVIGPFLPDLWNDAAGKMKFTVGAGQATNFVHAVRIANPS